jgi:hypothetical protein
MHIWYPAMSTMFVSVENNTNFSLAAIFQYKPAQNVMPQVK